MHEAVDAGSHFFAICSAEQLMFEGDIAFHRLVVHQVAVHFCDVDVSSSDVK